MLSPDALEERRRAVAASPDLSRLLDQLTRRALPALERQLVVPEVKALLSVDGGVCPRDGTTLEYSPWSPTRHRCSRCGNQYEGERHHRWWARFQHLWLGERIAHLATLASFADHEAAGTRARELLVEYGARYLDYPNRDNVLGPARLFFSTYLESIWVTNILAAAQLLRSAGQIDDATEGAVNVIADEAATLIADHNEGFSNRQTWNNTALAAVAVWFEDDELIRSITEGPTGAVAHLLRGYGDDGMWFEGENYHLFALRGLLTGLGWIRTGGFDAYEHQELSSHIEAALRAPTLSALPDFTFPARKDSRFGVSLAQPMYLELWEAGLAGLTELPVDLADWLVALYASPAPQAQLFDSYLHEAGDSTPAQRARQDLSWWMLLTMRPQLDGDAGRWSPRSVLLDSQGLAILRAPQRYASLECGIVGGGHGHPDRLHLTLHQDGVHWLPDPGTGSYVARDLFWYRSTLAHNAPRLDGASQEPGDARCTYFDIKGDWAWVQGEFGPLVRTVVAGPDHVLDVVQLVAAERRLLDLPWHFAGEVEITSAGRWEPGALPDEFATEVERFVREKPGPILLRARHDSKTMSAVIDGADELLRAIGPGVPGSPPAPFLVARAEAQTLRLVTVLGSNQASSLEISGDVFTVTTAGGTARHRLLAGGWEIEVEGETVKLSGARPDRVASQPEEYREAPMEGVALYVEEPPLLDGSEDGFPADAPLTLDTDDQYRRSEEPYPGADELSAQAYAAWNQQALFLAIDVIKSDVTLRARNAPPLRLDNEIEDIHSDGLQLYVRPVVGGPVYGFLIIPERDQGRLRVHGAGNTSGTPEMVSGAWEQTDTGYRVTLAVAPPGWDEVHTGSTIGFDLLVNEMRPNRERRAGQLVWSGGNGWIWVRGDRQDPKRFGVLELA